MPSITANLFVSHAYGDKVAIIRPCAGAYVARHAILDPRTHNYVAAPGSAPHGIAYDDLRYIVESMRVQCPMAMALDLLLSIRLSIAPYGSTPPALKGNLAQGTELFFVHDNKRYGLYTNGDTHGMLQCVECASYDYAEDH